MTGIVLTRAHQLAFNEWNVAIEKSRREYEAHPSLRWCSWPGCFEAPRPPTGPLSHPTRCAEHAQRKRGAKR